jgi:hypothetical protein
MVRAVRPIFCPKYSWVTPSSRRFFFKLARIMCFPPCRILYSIVPENATRKIPEKNKKKLYTPTPLC